MAGIQKRSELRTKRPRRVVSRSRGLAGPCRPATDSGTRPLHPSAVLERDARTVRRSGERHQGRVSRPLPRTDRFYGRSSAELVREYRTFFNLARIDDREKLSKMPQSLDQLWPGHLVLCGLQSSTCSNQALPVATIRHLQFCAGRQRIPTLAFTNRTLLRFSEAEVTPILPDRMQAPEPCARFQLPSPEHPGGTDTLVRSVVTRDLDGRARGRTGAGRHSA